jgi:hypothetical protein
VQNGGLGTALTSSGVARPQSLSSCLHGDSFQSSHLEAMVGGVLCPSGAPSGHWENQLVAAA